LILRSIEDAEIMNRSSSQFFTLVNDVCWKVNLASNVPVVSSHSYTIKKKDVISEKVMPGVASIAITKQIDDAAKRARSALQRIRILIKTIIGKRYQNLHKD